MKNVSSLSCKFLIKKCTKTHIFNKIVLFLLVSWQYASTRNLQIKIPTFIRIYTLVLFSFVFIFQNINSMQNIIYCILKQFVLHENSHIIIYGKDRYTAFAIIFSCLVKIFQNKMSFTYGV